MPFGPCCSCERSNSPKALWKEGDVGQNWPDGDQFDVPMTFDESQIHAHVSPMAAGEEVGAWDYGVLVYGAAWDHRREVATPSLMANMYGFVSKEMDNTKSYLRCLQRLPVGASEGQ